MAELIDDDFKEHTNSESIVAYQYSDLQKTAKSILAKATETANKKIEQAKKNIYELEEKMRQQGYDKGFAEGVAAGEIEGRKSGEVSARADFESKVGALNGALQNILGELNFRKLTIQAQAEADLLKLALEIAKKIVRREIQVDERFVVPILQEAVALTNNKNDLIIRVNSEDHRVIEEEIPTLEAIFSDLGRVSIIDDDSLERGGIKVGSRHGEVDMSLEEQFVALDKALIGDIDGMEEWDGEIKTVMPVAEEVKPSEAVKAPEPTPAPVVNDTSVQAQSPETPAEPESSTIQPTRRRGPRARKNIEGDSTSQARDKEIAPVETTKSNDSLEQDTPIQAPIDPAKQSSLSGVTDLTSLTLGSKEEDIIKEVLGSGGTEKNG